MNANAEWLAAYDAYDPTSVPREKPKRVEPIVQTHHDGSFVKVDHERCAQCGQLSLVGGAEGVVPYYVRGVGRVPGDRKVLLRWLHPGECSAAWHERYRNWLKEQESAKHQ